MHPGIERIDDYRWRIPKRGRMRVPGLIYAEEALIPAIVEDKAVEQVANVACLPGIVGHSIAMPDIHWGYGFPIGGVAAFDPDDGGRLARRRRLRHQLRRAPALARALTKDELAPRLRAARGRALRQHPVGRRQPRARTCALTARELDGVLADGAALGGRARLRRARGPRAASRSAGRIPGPTRARSPSGPRSAAGRSSGRSARATTSSRSSGSTTVYDAAAAARLGLAAGPVTVLIHTGSRGLGHQVCDDFIKVMLKARGEVRDRAARPAALLRAARIRRGAALPGRDGGRGQLRLRQPPADGALGARVARAAAWASRRASTGCARSTTSATTSPSSSGTTRRGARASCACTARARRAPSRPGHPALPAAYRDLGQPVLIPGDMGRYSFVLLGSEELGRGVRLGLPRRRAADVAHGGEEARRGAARRPGAGGAGDPGPRRRAGDGRSRRSPRPTRTWPRWSTSSTGPASRGRSRGSGRWR